MQSDYDDASDRIPVRTLLSTVGMSLVGWLKKANIEFSDQNRLAILNSLGALDPVEMTCGAEINTLALALRKRAFRYIDRVEFLTSDTDGGRLMGNILKAYVEKHAEEKLGRKLTVDVHIIEGLVPEDGRRFVREGLPNLINVICKRWQEELGNYRSIAIDATGGFKAQIAIATLMGQVLGVEVLYKYETFSSVEILPPLPVEVKLDIWRKHAMALERLATKSVIEVKEEPVWFIAARNDLGYVFFDKLKDGNSWFISLSVAGHVLHSTLKTKYGFEVELPADREGDAEVSWEDKNYGKGRHPEASAIIDKLIEKCRYITRVTVHYRHPAGEFRTKAWLGTPPTGEKHSVNIKLGAGGKTSNALLSFTKKYDDLTPVELAAIVDDINAILEEIA